MQLKKNMVFLLSKYKLRHITGLYIYNIYNIYYFNLQIYFFTKCFRFSLMFLIILRYRHDQYNDNNLSDLYL